MKETLWDPFVGQVDFRQDIVKKPHAGIKIPAWLRSVAGIMCLLGFLFFLAAFIYPNALWIGVPSTILGVIGMLSIDHLNNTERQIDWLLFNLAKQNNWAFEVLPTTNRQKAEAMEQLLRRKRAEGSEHMPGERPLDPRLKHLRERAGDLMHVKIGHVTILKIDAFFRGETSNRIPFWMAIGVTGSDMTLSESALKKDNHGNVGNQSFMFQMLCAYQLDRDTKIRARILHKDAASHSQQDFQTESVDFNRRFDISVADRWGCVPDDLSAKQQALLQALSPTTLAILIDLKDKYDVQLVIDGDTVFYSGWDRLNTSNFEVMGEYIASVSEAFAESAVSLKERVE